MSKSMTDPLAAMTGANADLFKFWISLWPVAPAFGVEWRFAEMMPKSAGFDPMAGLSAMPPMPGMEAMTAFWSGAAQAVDPATKPKPAAKAKAAPKAKAKPAPKPEKVAEPEAKADPVVVPFEPKEAEVKAEPAIEPVVEALVEPELDLGSLAPAEDAASARPAVLFEDAPADADDLQMIKGIGPGLESKLNALGIYKLDQIAGFSEADLQWIDENLTTFKGRCFRDDWVGQAKGLLA